MSAAKSESAKLDYRVKGGLWANAWKIAAVVGVLGLAGAGAAYTVNPERFAFSYLFGFLFSLTLALGATVFVLIQHLSTAHWSVTIRRTAEFFMAGMPVLAVLFLPLALVMGHLYPWLHLHEGHGAGQHMAASAEGGEGGHHAQRAHHGGHHAEGAAPAAEGEHGAAPAAAVEEPSLRELSEQAEHANHHAVLMEKSSWLTRNGFLIRATIYFAIWIFLGSRLFGLSRKQDETKDPLISLRAHRLSPVGMMLFALSLTFAAFDWIMSLDPSWYSTIFGVWIFAGCLVAILATLILVTLSLRKSGYIGEAINVEHFHDLGKLLFGFNVFWAYISFSQFFLIWYAGIPEETSFFHRRWGNGPWVNVSLALLFLHFVLPFVFLLSRNIKRRLGLLQLGAALLLVMHVIEVYWWVLPNYHHDAVPGGVFEPNWGDACCLLGVAGCYLTLVFYFLANNRLIPVGDPRLQRSLHHDVG